VAATITRFGYHKTRSRSKSSGILFIFTGCLARFSSLIHTNSASIQAVLDIVGFYQDITGNTNPNLIWEKFNNAKLTKTQPKAPTAGSRSPPPHTDKAFENPVSKELSNTRTCVVPVEN